MVLLSVDCDEQSNFYAVSDTGALLYYRDQARDGTASWAFGGASRQIGIGWQNIHHIICGDGGVIYAIDIDAATDNGRLLFFKDLARNGTESWASGGGVQVLSTSGWENYTRVFSGGDGILYAIGANGDLFYLRDEARNGTIRWSFGGVPQKIGEGWNGVRDVAYGGDGIIYAVTPEGKLQWFRDLARNGTASWANGGIGLEIGEGWTAFARLLSGQDGVLYGITSDGIMLFYRDLARNGTASWANGAPRAQIGTGWFVGWQNTYLASYLQFTNVAGYAWPMSVRPGEHIGFYVSARADYSATYLRTKVTDGSVGNPIAPGFAGDPTPQGTPPLPWQNGCGWNETFGLDITEDFVSGLYVVQCVEADGTTSFIPFTVRPSAQRADFAVLTCSNTLNAYNAWGGRSKYRPSKQSAATLSFQRPNPIAAPVNVAPGANGYGLPEYWVLNWMEDQGYSADVFAETDFETGIDWLQSYKALILNNHPEYWTDLMRDRLDAFLAAGGSLLYLGGNGLFERCVIQDGGTSTLFYDGDPSRGRPAFFFRNATPPRPEREVLGVAYMFDSGSAKAAYRVLNSAHPFYHGTGLKDGDFFGATGRNGGASGWEMDSSIAGTQPDGVIVGATQGDDRGSPPANLQLLAVGTNTGDGNAAAHMVYYRHAGGGIVFSVGSLTFTGSLADDPIVQRIVANVLDTCRDPILAATLHDSIDPHVPVPHLAG